MVLVCVVTLTLSSIAMKVEGDMDGIEDVNDALLASVAVFMRELRTTMSNLDTVHRSEIEALASPVPRYRRSKRAKSMHEGIGAASRFTDGMAIPKRHVHMQRSATSIGRAPVAPKSSLSVPPRTPDVVCCVILVS